MKTSIILIFSLICSVFYGQNNQPINLGIGFAIAENPYLFENGTHPDTIFTNSQLTKKVKNDKISPFFYKPDYGLYHFICLEKNKNYYKVLINDSEIGYLPNNETYLFKSWETILMAASVQRNDKSNLIRNNPSENSKSDVENNCSNEVMQAKDVIQKQGEFWIEISFATDCSPYPDENAKLKRGWIKWRNSKELLVQIFLLC